MGGGEGGGVSRRRGRARWGWGRRGLCCILRLSQVRVAPLPPTMWASWIPVLCLGGYARLSQPLCPRTERGGSWSQPSRCPLSAGVCLLLPPEPVGSEGAGELRIPARGAGLRPGSGRGCGPACGIALRWSLWAKAGYRSVRARGLALLPGSPHSYPQPVYSSFPVCPLRRSSWGPTGTVFPRCGEGNLPHSPPPSKPSRLSRLGVFVEPHRGKH